MKLNGFAVTTKKRPHLRHCAVVARAVVGRVVARLVVHRLEQVTPVWRAERRRVVDEIILLTSVERDGEGEARDDRDDAKRRKELGALPPVSEAQHRA